MNKTTRNNVDGYLPIRRILILSLSLTIGYYLLFALTHYFSRPSLADPEMDKVRREQVTIQEDSSDTMQTITLPSDAPMDHNGHKQQPRPALWVVLLLNVPLSYILVFAVFLYNRLAFSYPFELKRDELTANLIGSLVIGLMLSTMITLLQLQIWPQLAGPHKSIIHHIQNCWWGDLPLMAFAVMMSYLLRAMHREKMSAVENEVLRTENIRVRYEALKNQLDPHFLFNSMNTLQSLIEVDPEQAEDYVQQLSTVLRFTLQKREVVTLAEELACVADYCRMLKMRYGDNLVFDHHIDHNRYDNHLVPPLAVQGLVENAIKHNVISTKQPLTVHISTDDSNHLIIKNKIQPKLTHEEGTGLGLANLVECYRLQWDKKVEIFDDGNDFIVTLPLVNN